MFAVVVRQGRAASPLLPLTSALCPLSPAGWKVAVPCQNRAVPIDPVTLTFLSFRAFLLAFAPRDSAWLLTFCRYGQLQLRPHRGLLEDGPGWIFHFSVFPVDSPEVEDFDSIVSCSEKLNHPTASRPRVTDRRPRSQTSSTSESKLPVPPKPAVPPSPWGPSEPRSRSEPPTLEELRTQLRDLRATLEQMKMQHKKEIKQLMNELDEEKKIRLSLQVEVEHIKKVLSK
ncbi:hypothetical protein Z043_121245 [Scleropages formosus]|uniref:SH3 domain-containing kinase-binding protein 1-like n=1 Tax=Scleropages formosus TaxID=113540 RepID=A0A0P7UMA8_SCLFO|nr:hypothetical protein Z043_121245 [Scleropages formosus]